MSVVMREARFTPATEERVLRRIRQELGVDELSVERDLALVMVVGRRHAAHDRRGRAGVRAIAHAKVNLEMITRVRAR